MKNISPIDRIYCAVDTQSLSEALLLADLLNGEVGGIKLGKEFFTANGPEGVHKVAAVGHKIFLDLKYHDIPTTVSGAIHAANDIQCKFVTVHASGGACMLEAAIEAATKSKGERPKILAVTVLTSLDERDLSIIGQSGSISDQVLRLARLAKECGVDGVVCSPHEVVSLREEFDDKFFLVSPGVRPAWASSDDQKRFMTPQDAVQSGADYLVIGRAITQADDPVGATRRIVSEISNVLS